MTTVRICFFGDSVSIGTGDSACRGWPSYLSAAETQKRGHDISSYNMGIRAETSRDIAQRWKAESIPRLPPHVDGRLVFMFGLNDAADFNGMGVRVPLEASVSGARTLLSDANDGRRVLWIGPTPVRREPPSIEPGQGVHFTFDRSRVATLNARYKEAAAAIGIPYLDLHPTLLEDPAWNTMLDAGDGVHPDDTGHKRIAALVEEWRGWRDWFDG